MGCLALRHVTSIGMDVRRQYAGLASPCTQLPDQILGGSMWSAARVPFVGCDDLAHKCFNARGHLRCTFRIPYRVYHKIFSTSV